MDQEEYLEKSRNLSKQIEILRNQINNIVEKNAQKESKYLEQPLIDRQQELIGKLVDLNHDYWSQFP